MKKLFVIAGLLAMTPAWALAQKADHPSGGQGYLFFGLGAGDGHSVQQAGGGGEFFLYKGLGLGGEAGYSHGSRGGYGNSAAVISGDISYHFGRNAPRGKADPFVILGPTAHIPTSGMGHVVPGGTFGVGVNWWLRRRTALRLEVRNYVNAAYGSWPEHHYIAFRVGVTFR